MYNDAAQFSMFAVTRYSGTDSERVISSADNWNWLFAGHGQYANRVAHLNGWIQPIDNSYPQDNNDWHFYHQTVGFNQLIIATLKITMIGTSIRSRLIIRIGQMHGLMLLKFLPSIVVLMIPTTAPKECSSMDGRKTQTDNR